MIGPILFLLASLAVTGAFGVAGFIHEDDRLLSVAISAFGIDLACLLFFI
jgi:hypothetical protein